MTIFTLQKSPLGVEKVLSESIYFMENNRKVHTTTENLPGTQSVKKIPGIGRLIGQVCGVTKSLFVYNDKPAPTNQATYCLWYVAVE